MSGAGFQIGNLSYLRYQTEKMINGLSKMNKGDLICIHQAEQVSSDGY